MYTIDWFLLFVILLINGLMFIITYLKIENGIRRIYYIFTIIPLIIYSGIAFSYKEINNYFFLHYLIYSSTLMLTMFLGFRNKKQSIIADEYVKIDRTTHFISLLGTTSFFLTFIVFLLVPEIRIQQILFPPSPTVIGIYDRVSFSKENILLDLAQMLRVLFIPFFMIYLFHLLQKRKKLSVVILVLIWLYLHFLSNYYIGRSELLVYFLLIFYVFIIPKNLKVSVTGKQYLFLFFIFVLSMPLLLAYQFIRTETVMGSINFGESIKELFFFETDFPKYYYLIPNMIGQITPINYFLFFVLLPIPSVLFPTKGDILLSVNKIFTSNILGIEWGERGYSGLLPTLFGESLIIFGPYFFVIHAIFIGVLLTSLCKLLEKKKHLNILSIYFAVSCITIARGGSQGYFGLVINSLIFYLFITYLIKLYKKKYN